MKHARSLFALALLAAAAACTGSPTAPQAAAPGDAVTNETAAPESETAAVAEPGSTDATGLMGSGG